MSPNTVMQKAVEYHREREHRFQRQSGQEQGGGAGLNTPINRWTSWHQAITGMGKSHGTNQNMTRQNTDFTGKM